MVPTTSLAPIPGYTHLHSLEVHAVQQPRPTPTVTSLEAPALVSIALAAYFGTRPIRTLSHKKFCHLLLQSLGSGKDSSAAPRTVTGPINVVSSHVQERGNRTHMLGTVQCQQHTFGYHAAFIQQRAGLVMTSLHVTSA